MATPDLGGNEAAYVADAIASSWISSTGAYVDRFERDFAAFTGSRAAIADKYSAREVLPPIPAS